MRGDAALRQAVQAWEKRLIALTDLVPVTPAPAGSWEPLVPGLARKRLWNDNTFLLRVDPGATRPGHLHAKLRACGYTNPSIG